MTHTDKVELAVFRTVNLVRAWGGTELAARLREHAEATDDTNEESVLRLLARIAEGESDG